MKPGDAYRCSGCGAVARASWPNPSTWQEGWPMRVEWSGGPEPRVWADYRAPDRCPFCEGDIVAAAAAATSPLDRYEELAAAFHRETGMLAPGKDQPAAMNGSPSDEERAEAWRTWCATRAAAAAPPRRPPAKKGQLGLFG